jgi:spore cortex formation protein SpoVR/YcgB (stage V sporulation)
MCKKKKGLKKRKVSNSNPFAHGLQVDREEKMMYTCATREKKTDIYQ